MMSTTRSEVVLGVASSGMAPQDFRQAVKWNAGVQVVDVMVTDVGREPAHDGAGLQKT